MQFVLLPRNTRDVLESWEPDFKAILAWIESLEAPKYPWPIDKHLAAQGEKVFTANCSRCHGTYGDKETYPNRVVALDDVGTDPVRAQALTTEHRRWMQVGWLSRYGDDEVVTDTKGYIAPPLDGIWATAPYFHNGSVPTLWHVLHSDKRPAVWRRTEDGYDRDRVGLEVTAYKSVPENSRRPPQSREFFNTSLKGKSADGHTYPDELTPAEKRALLEYLKTL
jgi:mono/diheme cytochrome c family protein